MKLALCYGIWIQLPSDRKAVNVMQDQVVVTTTATASIRLRFNPYGAAVLIDDVSAYREVYT